MNATEEAAGHIMNPYSRELQAIDYAMEFEGSTTDPALRLMAAFQHKTTNLTGGGQLIEFGTFRGRVAGLMGHLKQATDSLHLVDTATYLDQEKLNAKGIEFQFYQEQSESWFQRHPQSQPFILSHHDASHYFDNVLSEITQLEALMDSRGVMVLDDFNDPFNQVRAAYYYARYQLDFSFELCLIGFGKAMLVHQDEFSNWEDFILNQLQTHLNGLGLATTLFRTDIHQHSRAFSIQQKRDPESPDRYGEHIWGDRFYRRSF